MRRLAGRILTPDGFVDGTLSIGEDGLMRASAATVSMAKLSR